MALSWDEQIRALKAKAEEAKSKKKRDKPAAGRCPSCQSSQFKLQMRDRQLIRLCKSCGGERIF